MNKADAARQGAIKGAIAGAILHVALWVGAIAQGQPLQISPLILLVCVAVGAGMAVFNKR